MIYSDIVTQIGVDARFSIAAMSSTVRMVFAAPYNFYSKDINPSMILPNLCSVPSARVKIPAPSISTASLAHVPANEVVVSKKKTLQ